MNAHAPVVSSLWHSPRRFRHRALPGIVLCGARTFLPSCEGTTGDHPSGVDARECAPWVARAQQAWTDGRRRRGRPANRSSRSWCCRARPRVTRVHPGCWAGGRASQRMHTGCWAAVPASHAGAPRLLGGRAREPRGCTRVVGRACARATRGARGLLGGRAREPRGCAPVVGRPCPRATRVRPGCWAGGRASHAGTPGSLGGRAREPRGCTRVVGGRARERMRGGRIAAPARARAMGGHARSLGDRVREATRARVDRYATRRACRGGRTGEPRRPHAEDRRGALRSVGACGRMPGMAEFDV
jgi:hypothetical protein